MSTMTMLLRLTLTAALLVAAAATVSTTAKPKPSGQNVPLDLEILTDAESSDKGAVCLDGTNPAFYWTKGTGDGAKKWVLYFKGGGWCYDETSCASRANTSLGSTKPSVTAKTFSFSGMMDSQQSVNPTFHNANRVVLWYCDGASFSGNADKVNTKTGTHLHFRGRRNLDAILDVLLAKHGLDSADEVLLSGGSAGGLAVRAATAAAAAAAAAAADDRPFPPQAYLHTDYVHSRMPPSVKKFKSSPVSGFFLLHENAAGVPLYPNDMKYVYNMQNSSGGVNAACLVSLPKEHQWSCIFANYSYAHTKVLKDPCC